MSVKLRKRFVDDLNLPISVLDSPYFEYQLKLYDEYISSKKLWEWVLSLIEKHYNGNENLFLEDYYQCRDIMITNIEKSEAYKNFISESMDGYTIPSNAIFNKIPKTSVYTKINDGKCFLSIDLKQANFQALKYHNSELVNNTNDYNEFLKYYIGNTHPLLTYFKMSKYTRQIIFGKLNMSRNVTIQNYILYQIFNEIYNSSEFDNGNIKTHSKQVDELIFEMTTGNYIQLITKYFKGDINNNRLNLFDSIRSLLGDIQVDLTLFQLRCHDFETSSGNIISVYEKKRLLGFGLDRIGRIKSCPLTYFPQVYKLISDSIFYGEISDEDLVFYYEKNLCRFLTPIKKL